MYSIVFTAGDESQVLAEFATKEEARAYGDRVYRDYMDRGMLTMQQTLRKDANGGLFRLFDGWGQGGRR